MNVSLVVQRVGPDATKNLEQMTIAVTQSAKAGAHLVLFPEAATTGLILNDDPKHDLMLGEPVPGPAVTHFIDLAKSARIHIAFGILERDGAGLYDSAVLVGPGGDLLLKYRRMDPLWHEHCHEPRLYRDGTECPVVETPIGKFAFAINGDLFNDTVATQLQENRPDYILNPQARHYDEGTVNHVRWEEEKRDRYLSRVTELGITVMSVNSLGDAAFDGGTFGGAVVIRANGRVTHSLHPGMPGMIVAAV